MRTQLLYLSEFNRYSAGKTRIYKNSTILHTQLDSYYSNGLRLPQKALGKLLYKRKKASEIYYTNTKKAPTTFVIEALDKRRRLPTLPHCIAVPSAQVGLTSLFGMGRGGTPPQ